MVQHPAKTWTLRDPSAASIDRLTSTLGCSELIATALANRGVDDPADARRFLDPDLADCHDPTALPDCEEAVELIHQAVERGAPTTIYADRDVDGVAGATILLTLLDSFGATVGYHIPGKYDGYGLDVDVIEQIEERDTELLVALDCGTTGHEAVRAAKELGMDVVIVDHHEPDATLPPADACVNPRRSDSAYPHADLAAGVLAYKLGSALVEAWGRPDRPDYDRYGLPLAALATVGDVVPLHPEHRALVHAGFEGLDRCDLPGIAELVDHCGVDSIRDLAWSLVPVLNAGREDESGDFVLRLLLAPDRDRVRAELPALEDYREQRRQERRELTAYLASRLSEQTDPHTDLLLFVEIDRFVGGGPIATLAERWGKPVFACRQRDDQHHAYARSASDVDLQELFEACDDLLADSWGHPGAGGFRVDAERFESARECLTDAVRSSHDPAALEPTVDIEVVLQPDQLTPALVEEIETLRPFGNGNEPPQVLMEDVEIGELETFGEGDRHCKLRPATTDSYALLYWDGQEAIGDAAAPCRCDAVGEIGWDTFDEVPALVVTDVRFQEVT